MPTVVDADTFIVSPLHANYRNAVLTLELFFVLLITEHYVDDKAHSR